MLPNPHPAAPSRPGRYCLKFQKPNGARMIHIWATSYAAQLAAVAVLGPIDRWRWHRGDTAAGRQGITCHCDALTRVAEYELDEEESGWRVPEPYATEIAQFLRVKK